MDIDDLDDLQASQRLVTMYKHDVDERITEEHIAYPLTQALIAGGGERQDIDPWRRFFEHRPGETDPDPITDILRIELRNLKQKWVAFYKHCSPDDQLDLGSSEPTIEGVLEVVNRIQRDWQSRRQDTRFGRVIHKFHRFCNGINAHKSFLEILPEGSEYVSIFTGTLSVILKASANHKRITEGLSEALSAITEHIDECHVALDMYAIPKMKTAVADLYAEIFLYLSDIMDYLTQKRVRRLLDSFNEDLYEKYKDRINNIKNKADKVQRLADQSSRAEVRVTRHEVENMKQEMILGREGEARRQAENEAAANLRQAELLETMKRREITMQINMMEQLAGAVNKMLTDDAFRIVVDLRHRPTLSPLGNSMGMETSMGSISTTQSYVADDVLLHSRHLEDFFDRNRLRLIGLQLRPVTQTDEVIRRLSTWAKSDPGVLWLEGPASPLRDEYNPLATIASRVIDLADQGQVPVISYFCHLPRGEKLRPGNATGEVQASVALITALTRQAMELLLPQFETSHDLSEARLSSVNGTLDSLSGTLELLGDVLEILDMQLLCIVDGLHWLDHRSTNTILPELVKTLRNSKTKVLFTTTGRSACLQREVSRMEKLTIESLNPRGSDVKLSGHTLALQ